VLQRAGATASARGCAMMASREVTQACRLLPQTTNPKGALNVVRRTWDTEEYAKRAEERENNEGVTEVKIEDELDAKLYRRADSGAAGPLNSKRAFLRARDFDVQVDSKLGKKKVRGWVSSAASAAAARLAQMTHSAHEPLTANVCACGVAHAFAFAPARWSVERTTRKRLRTTVNCANAASRTRWRG